MQSQVLRMEQEEIDTPRHRPPELVPAFQARPVIIPDGNKGGSTVTGGPTSWMVYKGTSH
jgi:hypothetical protein